MNNDLAGTKMGHMTLTKPLEENLWLAECDCGSIVAVHEDEFLSGKIKSCGNCKPTRPWKYPAFMKNPIGRRFGDLTVIERGAKGFAEWVCECSCGNRFTTTRLNLLLGRVICCPECKERESRKKNHLCKSCIHNPPSGNPIHYCEVIGGWVNDEYSCDEWACRAKGGSSNGK